MNSVEITKARVDQVSEVYKFHTTVDVLRLDLVHPVISGNKWFKLKEYVKEAIQQNKKILGTFGGPYSNHILATAAVAALCNMKSIGVIRGEAPIKLSETLQDASHFGMELVFVSRSFYSQDNPIPTLQDYDNGDIFWIDEGGYGWRGALGAQDIASHVAWESYNYILAAIGTGTTIAGLTSICQPQQRMLGIPVIKNVEKVKDNINQLIPKAKQNQLQLIHDYHFGGYAKKNNQLIAFMNEWFTTTGIPSDFVYTAKLFFAANDLINKNYFSKSDRVLIIHSGGLQGNRSLPKGTLIF